MKTIQVYDQPIDHRPDHRRGALLRNHDLLVSFSRGVPLITDASYAARVYNWPAQRPLDRDTA
jgi:hypothetical protein